ncbi:hypothetical protein GCM10007216_20230 [Thalassobacillus devorans]|uniref:FAS1-like dehydratase domain-containing protein n=1 Tax=Thalassobacillus devorans TaxID=279813 RepID=A0ABQ1P4W8_9BACI|nr:MaoC family dehydratase N-terminal domain-containing protein [Thalassobacillus devorans]NIK28033.1 hypothetical protein [Thalassobacillus devorans]GGC89431.1 hypothetical protein GCM10007216_20230 [Thalassobacillus devorans]
MEETLRHDYAPFIIERGKIKEFALALGVKNCIHYDKEKAIKLGYRDVVAPPTFGTVIDFWNDNHYYQFLKKLSLTPEDVLHGEQSYEYIEEICAGDEITGTVRNRNTKDKGDKIFFYLETNYFNQHSKLVLIGRATLVTFNKKEVQE